MNMSLFINLLDRNISAVDARIEAQAWALKYILFVHICGTNTFYI